MTIAMATVATYPMAASFNDLIPLLFIAYVIFAIIASLAKAVKQARQAATRGTDVTPAPGMTADQVRSALAQRRAVLQATLQRVATVPTQGPQPARPQTSTINLSAQAAQAFEDGSMGTTSVLTAVGDQPPGPSSAPTLVAAFKSLPPAALAIVASAVIGPCAAHRGAGHQPEDW